MNLLFCIQINSIRWWRIKIGFKLTLNQIRFIKSTDSDKLINIFSSNTLNKYMWFIGTLFYGIYQVFFGEVYIYLDAHVYNDWYMISYQRLSIKQIMKNFKTNNKYSLYSGLRRAFVFWNQCIWAKIFLSLILDFV